VASGWWQGGCLINKQQKQRQRQKAAATIEMIQTPRTLQSEMQCKNGSINRRPGWKNVEKVVLDAFFPYFF